MSRVSDYDDYDPLDAGRWEHNLTAALNGKKGQVALREIEAALLALPEPKLAYETFCKVEDGQVSACVLGVYARHKGITPPEDLNGDEFGPSPAEESADWARANLGLVFTLAYTLVDINDTGAGHYEGAGTEADPKRWVQESEEARYVRVLRYVRHHIKAPA